MISNALKLLALSAALRLILADPALAADVEVRLTGSSGGTATVMLNTETKRWVGTNGPGEPLLKARNGTYLAGTNVVPGFAVKGTGLLDGTDGKVVDTFCYNLIPTESKVGDTGRAQMLGTGSTGNWTRR